MDPVRLQLLTYYYQYYTTGSVNYYCEMFQPCRSPRSNTITIPNTLQRALYIQNIQFGNCQDWFSNNFLVYTECLNTLDGICYHKCCNSTHTWGSSSFHSSSHSRHSQEVKHFRNFFPLLSFFRTFLAVGFLQLLTSFFSYSLSPDSRPL